MNSNTCTKEKSSLKVSGSFTVDDGGRKHLTYNLEVFSLQQTVAEIVKESLVKSTPEEFNETMRRIDAIMEKLPQWAVKVSETAEVSVVGFFKAKETAIKEDLRITEFLLEKEVELGLSDDESEETKH